MLVRSVCMFGGKKDNNVSNMFDTLIGLEEANCGVLNSHVHSDTCTFFFNMLHLDLFYLVIIPKSLFPNWYSSNSYTIYGRDHEPLTF